MSFVESKSINLRLKTFSDGIREEKSNFKVLVRGNESGKFSKGIRNELRNSLEQKAAGSIHEL